MGIVGWSLIGFGGECSGIVCAVGPDVKDLSVGDRVATLASWTFSTRVVASEEVCIKIPSDLSFENAATMASVYSTVIHGLIDLGQLHRGSVSPLENTSGLPNSLQTVLIHSACGGVGIAAIQLCQAFGATVSFPRRCHPWSVDTSQIRYSQQSVMRKSHDTLRRHMRSLGRIFLTHVIPPFCPLY